MYMLLFRSVLAVATICVKIKCVNMWDVFSGYLITSPFQM